MNENDGHFLHRQAELCIALSRSTFDLTVAGRLRTMADELRKKASELEDQFEQMPAAAMGRCRSSSGSMDRD